MADFGVFHVILIAVVIWFIFQIVKGFKEGSGPGSICPACGTQGHS